MDMDRYIGCVLDDRYEILEVIGSGGMSVVYKARCQRLNRLVAVKILKDENLQDDDFRRRFHAESQAVAMLSHPNIVSVYDVSSSDAEDYIVMELIDGITLKQYMEMKGTLNWKETLHFAIQIAKALEHAHSRGIVHRDIKPHNVMVLKNGSVKVADFGIARIMNQSSTQTKEALGSVHYISPEQAKGGAVDNRSDLYSLGVVMYEMITGRPPYDGDSPVAVAIQHINGGAVKPSTLNPNIPKGLEQILCKAMSRDVRERYASATAMLADMDEFRRNPERDFSQPVQEPEAAAPVPSGRRAPQPPPQKKQPRPRDYEREESNRSSIATIAVVSCSVVAMIAIIVMLVVMIGGGGSDTPTTIRVPDILGEVYEELPPYSGVEIIRQSTEYSQEYPAGQIIRQEPEGGSTQPYGTKIFVTVSLGPAPELPRMPDMEGKTQAEALQLLDDLKLNLQITVNKANSSQVPEGQIISTQPASGVQLKQNQYVTVTVSQGPKVTMAEMPDLLKNNAVTQEAAQGMLDRRGFTNVDFIPVNSLLPEGIVVSQNVAPYTNVNTATPIIVEVSNGIPPEGFEPPQPEVFVLTLKDLPESQEDFLISVVINEVAVVIGMEVEAGQTSVDIELDGEGVQQVFVFINGEFYQMLTVDFGSDVANAE